MTAFSTVSMGYASWALGEYAAMFRSLVVPQMTEREKHEFRALLSSLGYETPYFEMNLGRTALAVALMAAKVAQPGRRVVLVPSYVCPSVVDVVRSLELTPVPVPVDGRLVICAGMLNKELSQSVLAVVAVHMYGVPCDIDAIHSACRPFGALVVEDSAHVVGPLPGLMRPAGCNGDVGILSFNQSKTLTGGSPNGGGLLLVQNEDIEAQIRNIWRLLPTQHYRVADAFHFLTTYQLESITGPVRDCVDALHRRLRRPVESAPTRLTFEKMSDGSARILISQLRRLKGIMKGRMRVFSDYASMLPHDSGVALIHNGGVSYASRIMVLLPRGSNNLQVRRAMRRHGIRTRLGYPAWVRNDGVPAGIGSAGSGMFMHDWHDRLIELPGGSGLTKANIKRVLDAMTSSLLADD